MAVSKLSHFLQDAFLVDQKSHYSFVPAKEDLNDLLASVAVSQPSKPLTREAFKKLAAGYETGLFSVKNNSNDLLAVSRFYRTGDFALNTLVKGMSYYQDHKLSGEPISAVDNNVKLHSVELTHNPINEFLQFAHKVGATGVKDFSQIEAHSDKFNFALKIAQSTNTIAEQPVADTAKRQFQFIVIAAAVMTAVAERKPDLAASLLHQILDLSKLDPAKTQRHFGVLATHDLDMTISDQQITRLAELMLNNDEPVFADVLEIVDMVVFEFEKRDNPILNDYHLIQMNPGIPTTDLSIGTLGTQANRDEYKKALSSVENKGANYLDNVYDVIGGKKTIDMVVKHAESNGFEQDFKIDIAALLEKYLVLKQDVIAENVQQQQLVLN